MLIWKYEHSRHSRSYSLINWKMWLVEVVHPFGFLLFDHHLWASVKMSTCCNRPVLYTPSYHQINSRWQNKSPCGAVFLFDFFPWLFLKYFWPCFCGDEGETALFGPRRRRRRMMTTEDGVEAPRRRVKISRHPTPWGGSGLKLSWIPLVEAV